ILPASAPSTSSSGPSPDPPADDLRNPRNLSLEANPETPLRGQVRIAVGGSRGRSVDRAPEAADELSPIGVVPVPLGGREVIGGDSGETLPIEERRRL